MKNLIFLAIGLWMSGGAFSQTITIKDENTEQPIEFVSLSSDRPKAEAKTNAEGQADISNFKAAEKIEIRTRGYKTVVYSYAELESVHFELKLEFYNLNLEEVVVSGTRWRQTTNKVPSKIVSISPKDVNLQNPQTAADLLEVSGKVYIQKSQQGGGSPVIRGFSTNRLLYTVDGVRMNTAIFRSGNIQNVINLDPFAIENTEVLFGPGSVIYGSDAIGGVMSFQTLVPQLSLTNKPLLSGKAVTRFSTANKERTGHFNVNVGWKKWAMVTSFSAWDFDHLRQGSNGPEDYLKPYFVQRQDNVDRVITLSDPLLQVPSAYSQMNLMQKIRFKPNEKLDFQYGFHYSETSPYGRYDRHNRVRNGTARYAEWNYGPQLWMMNNLNFSHNGNNDVYDKASVRLAKQLFKESRIDRSLNNNQRNTQSERVEAFSVNLDFNKLISKKNTLSYGAEYVLNEVLSDGLLTNISNGTHETGPSRYPQATWVSAAVFINDELRISDKFSLQAGLRYNQFILKATFDTTFYPLPFTQANIKKGALTGSFGGVFRPTENWIISANFGTAFRSPNVDDLGKIFDSEPGTVTVPNPDLKAEYAYNVDLGIAKVFGDLVKLDVSVYFTQLNNALVRRDFQLNGLDSIPYNGELSQVQAIQNAAVANVYGVQAGLEVRLSAGFSFSSDLNYQLGEEELDDGTISPSRHSAPLFGVSRLSYNFSKLNFQVYAMYQGERKFEDLAQEEKSKDEIYAKDVNGNNYSPSWCTLNFKSSYQMTNSLSVNAGIENITDQRYRTYSSGISAPGRNFIISAKAIF